jgi:hypothetical protein
MDKYQQQNIQRQESITKSMLNQVERKDMMREKTLNKIEQLIDQDLKHTIKAAGENEEFDREALQKDIDSLKEVSKITKGDNGKITKQERQEQKYQQMVTLSSEAKKISDNHYSRKADDIILVGKDDLKKNEPRDKALTKNAQGLSQAIADEEHKNYKTIRISEEMALKHNHAEAKKQTKSEIDSNNIKKAKKEKLNLSMNMDDDNNKESKGKALIEEKLKEKVRKNTKKLIKKVSFGKKRKEKTENHNHAGVDKFRNKFNKKSSVV